jgi:4-hydroxy-2-oxoheptanedioate aldolase
MSETGRLNGIIKVLEAGGRAFTAFATPEVSTAVEMSTAPYDGIVFECEHNAWDARELRDCLQYLLNRRQIATSASLSPQVTPIVRIPPNGNEMNQAYAKQALDLGAYGIVWPHISTVEQAYNAVAACRYPSLKTEPLYEPAGIRGDAPTTAARYWGLPQQEYYKKADVWPLNPEGEILVGLMIEDTVAIDNLDDILTQVAGIGLILIGEGDLSQELGVPRQYLHPTVVEHMNRIVETCKKHNVVVGHPHVDTENLQRVLSQGYRFLMAAPTRGYDAVTRGRELAKG